MPDQLLAMADVARLLGLSRQRIHQLTKEDAGFPEPVARLTGSIIYRRSDIEEWAKQVGRQTAL